MLLVLSWRHREHYSKQSAFVFNCEDNYKQANTSEDPIPEIAKSSKQHIKNVALRIILSGIFMGMPVTVSGQPQA